MAVWVPGEGHVRGRLGNSTNIPLNDSPPVRCPGQHRAGGHAHRPYQRTQPLVPKRVLTGRLTTCVCGLREKQLH